MRWPLRRQILLPMAAMMLLTMSVVSALNAWLASQQVRQRMELQLNSIQQALSETTFPLQSNVLSQLRRLTGAEFVVLDASGLVDAASDGSFAAAATDATTAATRIIPSQIVQVAEEQYFHVVMPVHRRGHEPTTMLIHVFYAVADWRQARWQALAPPLLIGGVSIVVLTALLTVMVQKVTRPIAELRSQVERIAQGDFRSMPVPTVDDEVQDLAVAVNQMAARLSQYEEQIRSSERLRALGTLGGGIAHHIRNAATGCRIALDLHRRDCPVRAVHDERDEPLGVAVRQLLQIETHIQRLLAFGKPVAAARVVTDVSEIVRDTLELVSPMARHQGIRLRAQLPSRDVILRVDPQAMSQLLVNLVVNAVEAAAKVRLLPAVMQTENGDCVDVRLAPDGCAFWKLEVGNVGPGPAREMQARLFEPFATDKPGGTGLGLAVARQIAEAHGGRMGWEQRAAETWFVVSLPAEIQGTT